MSPGDILRLRTRHPGVDIEGRWRQWLEWVAADIPSRMPKDKHGAFYGWLKKTIAIGNQPRPKAAKTDQDARDMERFYAQARSAMEQAL